MSEITGYDEGTPCWVDLMTPDLGRAMEFYTGLFGWAYLDTGEDTGHYQLATVRGRIVAGLGRRPQGQSGPCAWTTYLWTDDLDAAVVRIAKAGGSMHSGPHDVPSAGRMALAGDSTGAVFGLWQGVEHRGAQLANEPGAFTWNEYVGGDPGAAREFYRAAFDYTYEDYAAWEIDYSMFKVRGEVRGGIGGKPPVLGPDTPNFWGVYFSVPDTDAAAEAVTRGGGTVQRPPFDTEVGRIAVATDPAGAPFCVISVPGAADAHP